MEKRLLREIPYEPADVSAESRWDRLPLGVRVAAGAGALLLPVAGIMAGISTMTVSSYPAPRFHAAPAELSPEQPAGTPAPGNTTHGPSTGGRPGSKSGTERTNHSAPTGPRQEPAALTMDITAAHDRRGPETVTGDKSVPATKLKAAPRPPAAVPAAVNRPPAAAPAEPMTTTHENPYGTGLVPGPPAPLGLKPVLSPGAAGHHDLRFVVTALNGHQPDRDPIGSSVTGPPKNHVLAADSGWHHHRFRVGMDAEQPAWSWQNDDERCDAFSLIADAADVTDTDFDFLSGLLLTTAAPDIPLDFPAFR